MKKRTLWFIVFLLFNTIMCLLLTVVFDERRMMAGYYLGVVIGAMFAAIKYALPK